MFKLLPVIIISSTIPLQENIIMIEGDYSIEAYEFMHEEVLDDSELDAVYNIFMLERLLRDMEVEEKKSSPTMK